MDMLTARHNMVTQQLQPHGVDEHVLKVFAEIPREQFLPARYKDIAYADTNVPIGNGKVLLAPDILGRLTQALNLQGHEEVLEIESGTGYLTAILAKLSLHVTSVESIKPLALLSNKNLYALNIKNFEIISGDMQTALQSHGAFDVVVITGSLHFVPHLFASQLTIGGKLFAVVGRDTCMHACIFTRINEREWYRTTLFETVIPPLREITNATAFEF